MGLTYFSDEEIYSFLDKELEGVVLEVELIQRASRSVSSASFEAPDIERLPNEASFELPPLFLKKTSELWGEENQEDEEVDKRDFQNVDNEELAYSEPRGLREHIVQQCMHGTKLGKQHSLYRSNFSQLVDEPSGRAYRYFLHLLEQDEYSWLDLELFEIATTHGNQHAVLLSKNAWQAALLERLNVIIASTVARVRNQSFIIEDRLMQLRHELANMASSSEDFGSLSDATMMNFLQSAKRFEATSFTEDLSKLADLIYSEMQQFKEDKENLEAQLLRVGLNWSIFENLFAMRRIAEHAEAVKATRGFLDDALGK